MEEVLTVYIENLMGCAMFFLGWQKRRNCVAKFATLSVLLAFVLLGVDYFFPESRVLQFVYYVIEFAVLVLIFHTCFRADWEQTLYTVSAGRVTQHLVYQILRLIAVWVNPAEWEIYGSWQAFFGQILLYVPFYVIIYLGFARKIDTANYSSGGFRRQMNIMSLVILFVCIGITRFAKNDNLDRGVEIGQCFYAITCCVLCLILQFKVYEQSKQDKEMDMVRMLWQEDRKRLAERRDTIELLNMKCHDIRHKLEDYHLALSETEKTEMEELIGNYDTTYDTGNETLDVLLSYRAFLCRKDHIELTFMGDAKSLKFLTEDETYSLFGNAIGNAVEAVERLDENKRKITLLIKSSGDLISISESNYYKGELIFENGLPATTAVDSTELHGYGMKSMRSIAEKYGGGLRVKAENGVFELTVWMMGSLRGQ